MRRLLLSTGVLLALASIGVGILAFSAFGTSDLSSADVSVLKRARSADDQLPERVGDGPSSSQFTNVDEARLAQTTPDARLYVVPGNGGALCLVVAWQDSTGTNCGSPKSLDNGAIYLARPASSDTMDVWGIVADGVQEVGRVPVENNAFAFHGPASVSLPLKSDSELRQLYIGSLQGCSSQLRINLRDSRGRQRVASRA
jgi:hypothetical protein